MSRSSFDRLGDHIVHDRASDVRHRAASGEPDAVAELAKLEASLTPEGLLDKSEDIVSQMLVRAACALRDLNYAEPPLHENMTVTEHGAILLQWVAMQIADPDSAEGRMIRVVGLCAQAMTQFENGKPETLLGFILGYGVAQSYFLALREYGDGPALARERELAKGRAAGGDARKNFAVKKHQQIGDAFIKAKEMSPHLSASAWATPKRAKQWKLAEASLRKIAGAAWRKAKNKPGQA